MLADLVVAARPASSPLLEVGAAGLGGDGEAGRHRQPEVGHLGEVGALAAEQVLHVLVALGEVVDVLRRMLGLPPCLLRARHRPRCPDGERIPDRRRPRRPLARREGHCRRLDDLTQRGRGAIDTGGAVSRLGERPQTRGPSLADDGDRDVRPSPQLDPDLLRPAAPSTSASDPPTTRRCRAEVAPRRGRRELSRARSSSQSRPSGRVGVARWSAR